MPESRVFADDMWELLATPISLIWFFFPTSLRKKITSIPRETVLWVGKAFWALIFYYWLYTILCPVIEIPAICFTWANQTTVYYQVALTTIGSWYATLKISFFQLLVPLITLGTWLSSWRSKPKPQTLTEQMVSKLSDVFYVPERAIQGSALIPTKELPSFMAFIYGVATDETETFVGCSFRVENALLTAAHNLTGFENLKIVSNTAVCYVSTETAVVFPYDDLAYFRLSDRDFSMLGLTKGRLLDHAVPQAYPMVCQAFGPGTPVSFTMGAVTPVANFGKVTYGGSTTHGFSGTPYIQHKTVVGMHLGAGMVNMGLDAAYIAMLLSLNPESTEDWLMDMIAEDQLNKRAVKWERSPVDPDEIYVQRLGKYFTIDASDFFSVYNPQRIVSESFTPSDKLPMTYSDSKNDAMASAHASVPAGATGQMSAIRNCVQTPLNANSFETPMSIKTLEETLATDNQEQMPVVQNGLLNCTSNNTTFQPEGNRRRQYLKKKKLEKSSRKSTNPGSPGLELIR